MENLPTQMGKDAVQRRYNKAIELEQRLRNSIQAKTPSDPNIWGQMRENYEAIILDDHDFSEAHEIEHALWHLHYKRIEEFRARMRSAAVAANSNIPSQGGKSVVRRDQIHKIRSVFKSFLSEATGFYHELILKIRARYRFPVDYFSHQGEDYLGSIEDKTKSVDLRKAQVSCHRCLIYLGDLARYKELYGEGESSGRDFSVAASYYVQAASLWPSSGNPHHQLAILGTYMGDELVAVYRYFRSLAVEIPFSTARDNLIIIFDKNRQHYSQLLPEMEISVTKQTPTKGAGGRGRGRGDGRFSIKDQKQGSAILKRKQINISEVNKAFRIRFVRLNGILFTRTSLETFDEVCSSAINEFEELLTPGPISEMGIGSDTLVNGSTFSGLVVLQIVSILIFTVHNISETENRSLSYAEILQRSVLLQNAFTAAFDFVGHIISKCANTEDVSSSLFLPATLVFMEWLACRPDIVTCNDVKEKQARARSSFWSHCVIFLNKLLVVEYLYQDSNGSMVDGEIAFASLKRYNEEGARGAGVALWEDFELRGFLPLAPAQLALDFSKRHSYNGFAGKKEKNIRVQRILAAAKAVANSVEDRRYGIYFDADLMKFFIAGEVPECKIEDQLEAVKPKVSNAMNKFDNVLRETVSNCAKQEASSFEKPVLCASGVTTVKTDSDKEEEEDEVIVFKPTVVEKHSELNTASNSQQNPVASASIQTLTPLCLPQEPRQSFSNFPPPTDLPIQISGYSSTLTNGTDHSVGAYTTPHEVSQLFESSVSSADHWSTGIGMSTVGQTNCLESWGTKNYTGPFLNSHAGVTSFGDFSQQPAQQLNHLHPAWYRDDEALVLNGMTNLNLSHHFQENGSLLKSELPASTMGKVESVSTHSNWIPSQSLYSSTPLVSGVSVSTAVSGISGKPLSDDLSLAMVQANSCQPKISTEPLVTNFESSALSKADTSITKTSIIAKPTNTPKLSIKKGHVNRPVRHFGPPPGFGPVPSRLPDGSKADLVHCNPGATCVSEQVAQSNEQPQMDDYSWLDGYTPSNEGERNDSRIAQPCYPLLPTSDNLISAAAKFPFPGKQVPSLPICQDQQFHLKQQQQQLQYKAQQQQQHQNQVLLPKQQHQQSLWSARFFG